MTSKLFEVAPQLIEPPDSAPLTLDDAVFLNGFVAAQFGQTPGTADQARLEIALGRPQADFHGEPYYASPFLRAAALGHALMVHKPFSTDNTRVSIVLVAAWLEREGQRLSPPPGQLRLVAEAVAAIHLSVRDLAAWLEANSSPLAAA